MAFELSAFRVFLYVVLLIFSTVLFCLSAARLHYTTHIPQGDPLNNGHNFYDPVIAEMLATTVLTFIWSIHAINAIHRMREHRATSFLAEQLSLFILFILWTVGAAYSTHIWGKLGWCQHYHACRLLTAIVAFEWMGWIILTLLLIISLLFAFANHAFGEPMHGRWDPRASHYRDSRASWLGRPVSV